MNNRIKQLMNDCVLEVEDLDHNDQTVYWTTFDKEKFAKLIVKECIDTIQKRYIGDNNREDMEVRRCVEDLKQHFNL